MASNPKTSPAADRGVKAPTLPAATKAPRRSRPLASAALPTCIVAPSDTATVILVDPGTIQATSWADRHPSSYDRPDYLELRSHIRANGVNHVPIKIRPTKWHRPSKPSYEVVYGHRRHRACLELGIKVRAVVEVLDDAQLATQLNAENLYRKNLSAYERGVSYARMLEHGLFERRRVVLSAELGVNAGDLSRLLFLAGLPHEVLSILNSPLDLAIHDADKLRPALAKHQIEVMKRVAQIAADEGTLPAKEAIRRLTDFKPAPKAVAECDVRPLEVKGQHCGQLTIDANGRVSIALSIALTEREIDLLHVAVRRLLKGAVASKGRKQ